jgi:excisionase family DNA binding protein
MSRTIRTADRRCQCRLGAGSRPTLTVDETATLLGVTRSMAVQAVRRGELPSVRGSERVRIPRHRLEAWLGLSEATDA